MQQTPNNPLPLQFFRRRTDLVGLASSSPPFTRRRGARRGAGSLCQRGGVCRRLPLSRGTTFWSLGLLQLSKSKNKIKSELGTKMQWKHQLGAKGHKGDKL